MCSGMLYGSPKKTQKLFRIVASLLSPMFGGDALPLAGRRPAQG